MITAEFSVFDLVTMVAVLVLAVLYVTLLLKLKPSTENNDHHKKDFLHEKRGPPPNGLIFVNSLKTKEKTTPPQRTQTPINSQKIRHPFIKTMHPSLPQDKNQETPEHVVVRAENPSSDLHCAHHFGYLIELPKNTPIPSECLGCPQVVECMTTLKVQKKLVKSHVANS
jgi:Ca2+/Na+ antiporter